MRHGILALVFFLHALSSPVAIRADGDGGADFMSVDELHRGMRGFGRTVFQGTAIDTFAVEILGVARGGLGPRQDLILVRLSGDPIEQTGIIRGMSGSPVYIEGRLIGAVAYGWTFSKVPICGITPIRQMLDVMERGMEAPQGSGSWAPVELDARATDLVLRELGEEKGSGRIALEPLGTPVWVSGMAPAAAVAMRELLQPLGLQVLAAPGGQVSDSSPALAPGAALGVQLISGDMSATGIGTLTYIAGDRIVGFGHPMMLAGATDMPLTGAFIYQVVPNQVSSFKMGAATQPIGALRQDRSAGIAGVLGAAPAMLPVRVTIASEEGEVAFAFGVVRHPDLVTGLARSVLLSSLEASEKLFGDATLELRTSAYMAEGQRLVREQVYTGQTAITLAALEAVRPLEALVGNRLVEVGFDSLAFDVDLRERIEGARVSGLRVERSTVDAGDTLLVEVSLQPYRSRPLTKRIEIRLPEDLAPGPLSLRVGSGRTSREWESRRHPDALRPRDGRQLLELLARYERDDDLICELYRPEEGLSIDGRELPGLPPSARAILGGGASAGRFGPVHGQTLLRRRVRTDYVLAGEQTLELTVGRDR